MTDRRSRALLVTLLLAAVLAVFNPTAATAQTGLDPNRCSIDPPEPAAGPVDPAAPTTTVKPRTTESDDGLCSGFMDSLMPGGDYGPHPTQNYDIGYDNGGNCVCWARNWTGTFTDAAFGAARWFVRLGLSVVNFALKFKLARLLAPAAVRMANTYSTRVIGPLGLGDLALFVCVFWGGMLAFAGKLGRGVSEIGSSLLIGAVGATLLANPATGLLGALDFTSGLSFEVAAMTTASDTEAPNADRVVGDSMSKAIHRTMIEVPHQILNWKRPIPAGDKCFAVYNAAVASGPWGTSSKPRVAMKKAGCTEEDKFNRDPSFDRFGGAVLVAVANFEVMALLVMIGATLIGLQISIVGCIALAPFAWVSGALPGRGRGFFWWWVGTTAVVLSGVLVVALLLSLTLVAIASVLTITTGLPLVVQMGTPVLIVAFALKRRKKMLASGHQAVSNFTQRMGGFKIAQRKGFLGSAGGRGLVGAGLAAGGFKIASQVMHSRRGQQNWNTEELDLARERTQAATGTNQRLDSLIDMWGGEPDPEPAMPEPVSPSLIG